MQLRHQLNEVKSNSSDSTQQIGLDKEEHEEEFEVAPIMGRIQVYANKLWFAGKGENWELASFYVEEIEEGLEEIEESDAEENGVLLSKAVLEWGLEPLEELEKATEAKDPVLFEQEYENMTINCSGCHVTTQHGYIKIVKPTAPIFTNQKYSIN